MVDFGGMVRNREQLADTPASQWASGLGVGTAPYASAKSAPPAGAQVGRTSGATAGTAG